MPSVERMYGVGVTVADQLNHVLNSLQPAVDSVGVYSFDSERLHLLFGQTKDDKAVETELEKVALSAVQRSGGQPSTLAETELSATPFRSGLQLPLLLDRQIIGVLALFSTQSNHYTPDSLEGLVTPHSLIQTIIQNMVLQQRLQAATTRLEKQQEETITSRLALVDALTDGIAIVLPQGDISRVMTVNTRFAALFGVGTTEAKYLTLEQLLDSMRVPRNVRQELSEQWLTVSALSSQTQAGEFAIPGPTGASVDVRWYSGPIMQHDRVRGRIYTFHDVTSENAATRLRAAWLSRVPHELRTPLTSISGFAQFILEETGDQLPELAREYTEIILNSARHLNRVFTGMIEISRADAGELSMHLSEAHLPDVIIETVARLEFQYKGRGLKVVMELDDDMPHLMIDVDRVSQVLTIILNNAIQYTPDGGRIRVSTQYITRSDELPESAPQAVICPCMLVSVIDEGEGLSSEEVTKVFEPFFRTSHARANMVEGSGLGLTMARSFIEAHRGKIWAETATKRKEYGGGRFFFVLPA